MWAFRKADGKAKGTQGWEADRPKVSGTYTGLWKGNKVVALLVSKYELGDEAFSDMGDRLEDIGNEIVTACNAHEGLVDALKGMLGAWNMVCDANGWERDHIKQQKDAVAALAAAGMK